MTLLEKLLVPSLAARVVEDGYDVVGGPVVRADDLAGATPAERVAAYGLDGDLFPFGADPDHVDVLRFASAPGMGLTVPSDRGERPWPTYPLGFLRNAAPVWDLDATRPPTGAQFVRIDRDGRERVFSEYGGAGWGWQRAKGYLPPLYLVGPRGRWRGLDLPASWSADLSAVELVWLGDEDVPEGFRPSRPRVHVREVPAAECDSVVEVVVTARWRDAPVRVLQQAGDEALVLLTEPDVDSVNRLGAQALEASLFQALAPAAELTDLAGLERVPAPEA